MLCWWCCTGWLLRIRLLLLLLSLCCPVCSQQAQNPSWCACWLCLLLLWLRLC